MLGRIILAMATSLLAAVGVWYAFEGEGMYEPHRFASEEAQRSLEVTEAQSAELAASARQSDAIVFAVFGALLVGIAGWFCHPTAFMSGRIRGALAGLVLGAVAGLATAFIGHWYYRAIPFPPEPMLYWIGRWVLMVLPIGIAAGLAVSIAGQFSKHVSHAVVGGILGGVVAIIGYCLLTGALTPLEGHHFIYPANWENRLLAMGLVAACIPGMIALQLGRSQSHAASPEAATEESGAASEE